MLKYLSMLLLIFGTTATTVLAQSDSDTPWHSNRDGTVEYNCDVVNATLSALADGDQQTLMDLRYEQIIRYDSGTEWDVLQYAGAGALSTLLEKDEDSTVALEDMFGIAREICAVAQASATTESSTGDTFTVTVTGDINMRACPGTNCDVVQTAQNGSLLTVIGEQDEWYEVQLEEGTAFIAAWLTTRGPDAIIPIDERYIDPRTGCLIVFDPRRGDMDIRLLLSGDRQNDMLADLYRPNETRSLPVAGQNDYTFRDTGEPYIDQYYAWDVSWPLGMYQIEFSLDSKTTRLGWELDERGDYTIHIVCD
ncbi:MAG: hypothetical protein CL610_03350 [Anaerolineaceae bacterium]|nr:hypothetical protein [Anaerolineaceae bacterium]